MNAKAEWSRTPLHLAALEGHPDVAALLIEKGANVNARDKLGRTPLEFAESSGHEEVAALLREHGGKSNRP